MGHISYSDLIYYYIDDLMLTSASRSTMENAVGSSLEKGWAISPQKVQGPGLPVKLWVL